MSDEILQQVNWSLHYDLGTNLYVNDLEKKNNKFEFKINLSKPIYHKDSFTNEKTLSHLILKEVGIGHVLKKNKISIKLPTYSAIKNSVNTRIKVLNNESEKIILSASSYNLAQLTETDHYLKPISYITSSLYHDGFFEVEANMSRKMIKYLNLLSDLELIRKVDGGYRESPKFITLKSKLKDKSFDQMKILVYSDVLANAYDTLRNFFNFKFIDQHIKIEKSYYADSFESNKLLQKTKKDMYYSFAKRYHATPYYKYYPNLQNLITVDCFKQDGEKIIGDEKIFDTAFKMREEKIDYATIVY